MKLMHFLLLILLLVLGLLIKQTWFDEETGRKKLDDLQLSLEELKVQNKELIEQNNHIRQIINGIKHNYSAREELARKHLGLIKEDETFFHVIPSETNSNYQETED
ncbi:MAG TPA: septum formation initiator family protein [Candidatus Ignatzschineria merdigallinarum]|uniref:Septum formation initiator family protein n=1 Tax=Candidatus Ignatzschineria merdigallinarum TaxID=2838621 RepID=A0A9D1Q777_9GAMM|nr:septum formation initiator family protein [Candidatus Ignatzschineria merdigallinarum]